MRVTAPLVRGGRPLGCFDFDMAQTRGATSSFTPEEFGAQSFGLERFKPAAAPAPAHLRHAWSKRRVSRQLVTMARTISLFSEICEAAFMKALQLAVAA